MPQQNVIHIDQVLTNFSQALMNEATDYIAPVICPHVPVQKRSDKWFVYGNQHFRYRDAKRRPGTVANEFEYTLSTSSYYAEPRAERHLILDDELMMEDAPLNADVDAAELITEQMLLNLEVDTATFLTSTANLTNNTALSGTSKWSDYVNSTPLTDAKTAKTSVRTNSAKRANVWMLTYETALNLADHPSIKDLIKYTDPKSLQESGLPPVVRGLRIVEAAAIQDGATEGRAFAPSVIWGKNSIIAYINPAPGLKKVSLAYTFVAPDPTSGITGLATRRYRIEEKKGEYIETEMSYDFRMVSPGCGYLFQTVV